MSTYTDSLGFEEITPGDQAGLWGDTTNNNLVLIDQAITGVQPISFAGVGGTTVTLVATDGSVTSTARSAVLNITGTATAANTVIIPNKQKTYLVRNNTTKDVVFTTASPTATYTVGAGNSILIFCDGNNGVFTGIEAPGSGTLGVAGGGTGATDFGPGGFVVSPGGTDDFTNLEYVPVGGTQPNLIVGQVQVPNGGTGQLSISTGSLLAGNGIGAMTVLPTGTSGQVLTSNGSGANPSWQASASTVYPGAGIAVSTGSAWTTSYSSGNPIPVSSGGTGATSLAAANIAIVNATNSFTGTNNYSSAASISMTSTGQDAQKITVAYGGYTTGISPTSIQLGASGTGAIYFVGGAFDGGNGIGLLLSGTSIQMSSSGNMFTSAGTAYKTGSSTAWTIYSDARIKKNVTAYTKGLAELSQINIKNFEFNGLGNSKDGQKGLGVIADEIANVLPDSVVSIPTKLNPNDEQKVDLKTFDSTELVYLLVNAVKELKAEVDALKAAQL